MQEARAQVHVPKVPREGAATETRRLPSKADPYDSIEKGKHPEDKAEVGDEKAKVEEVESQVRPSEGR